MIEVHGLRELETALVELNDAVTAAKTVQSALRTSAKPMLAAAKSKAHVAPAEYSRYIERGDKSVKKDYQPGHVGNQIVLRKHVDSSSRTEIAGLLLTVKRKGWWAQFFEHGAPHIPKKPFLLPALDETHQTVVGTFADTLKRAIARAIKRRSKQ